jgi:hypothetical protein
VDHNVERRSGSRNVACFVCHVPHTLYARHIIWALRYSPSLGYMIPGAGNNPFAILYSFGSGGVDIGCVILLVSDNA